MSHTVENKNVTSRVPFPPLSQKFCDICGARLDVHQSVRGGICADPVCLKKHVAKFAAQRRESEVADMRRIAAAFRARVAPALGVSDPESLTLAIVPRFNRAIVKLPKPRLKEFRAHVLRLVRQAYEEKLDAAGVSALSEELSQAVQPESGFAGVGACCATCRGHCCRTGGTHAYLNVNVMRSFLARHPGLSRRAVAQAFLEKLPVASFDYSCVYHGRHGCALPREMRSAICNQYYCQGLNEFRESLAASGPQPVLVVAADRERIGRFKLLQPDGTPRRAQKIFSRKP